MLYVFRPYNESVIIDEMRTLDALDRSDLFLGMRLFQELGRDAGVTVTKYSDYGIHRLKRNRAGRLLFDFTEEYEQRGENRVRILKSLVVFKKETSRTPVRILRLAQSRNQ